MARCAMELRQIIYFVAAAEEGNILSAARRLRVSQPPLTRQIHALEEHLGVKLFERHARGVHLTPAGKTFLEDARRMLELRRTSRERAQAANSGTIGQLDIGYLGTVIYYSLPRMLREFTKAFPAATLSITPMGKARQLEALRNGTIHMGVGRFYAEESGITVEHLEFERLWLAYPHERREVFTRGASLAKLRGEKIVLFPKEGRPSFADELISLLRRKSIEPKVAAIVDDVNAALGLVAAGVGVAIVPAPVARLRWPLVGTTLLADERAQVPVSIAYLSQAKSPILQAFLGVVHGSPKRAPREPAPKRERRRS